MEHQPPILVLLCASIALMAVIAIPSVMKVARLFKNSQQWEAENGYDRAERREFNWYRNSDPEKSRETLRHAATK
jgi:hypothetical protein